MNSPFASVRAVVAVLARQQYADRADAELLRRFAASREEAAFAELVRRYGPLVWRAARTAAGNDALAEDAFQATFLALARHAGSLRRPAALVGWLHRTARRAAARARRFEAKRSFPRAPAEPAACADPLDRLTARELLTAVEEEIAALPEAFRVVLLLCGVEGLSQEEAAARLGWSPGSVKGRLERARARLRKRLALRGLTVPALLGGATGVPPQVVATTLALVEGGEVPPQVAELVIAKGMTHMSKFAWVVSATIGSVVLALGLGYTAGNPTPTPDDIKSAARSTDGDSAPLVLWSATLPHVGVGANPKLRYTTAFANWTPDGKQVLTPGEAYGQARHRGEVWVWDAANGQVVDRLMGDAESYSASFGSGERLAISADGSMVAAPGRLSDTAFRATGRRFVVDVWLRTAPRQPRYSLDVPEEAIGVCFGPAGKTLFAVTRANGHVIGWKLDNGKVLFGSKIDLLPRSVGSGIAVNYLACHPNGKFLAVAQNDGRVSFWDTVTGRRLDTIEPPRVPGCSVICLAFSPDGKSLLGVGSFSNDQMVVTVWNVKPANAGGSLVEQGRAVRVRFRTGARTEGIDHITISPDGKTAALACTDKTVRLLDLATRRLVGVGTHRSDQFNNGQVSTAAFSPDGKRLLTVGHDAIKVWSVAALRKQKVEQLPAQPGDDGSKSWPLIDWLNRKLK